MSGSITLAQVAARTSWPLHAAAATMRDVTPLTNLIARHGAAMPIPALLRNLSADCPKRQSATDYDLCGINCPELPALFRT